MILTKTLAGNNLSNKDCLNHEKFNIDNQHLHSFSYQKSKEILKTSNKPQSMGF
jgi:hypothetical protein